MDTVQIEMLTMSCQVVVACVNLDKPVCDCVQGHFQFLTLLHFLTDSSNFFLHTGTNTLLHNLFL